MIKRLHKHITSIFSKTSKAGRLQSKKDKILSELVKLRLSGAELSELVTNRSDISPMEKFSILVVMHSHITSHLKDEERKLQKSGNEIRSCLNFKL